MVVTLKKPEGVCFLTTKLVKMLGFQNGNLIAIHYRHSNIFVIFLLVVL